MTALQSQSAVAADPDEQRRLAAIVFTDVVGYSRLAEQDEQKTLALVRRDLKIISDTCESLGGSALKNTGDGLLMCFSSAEAAVSCALRVQKAFTDAPKTLPPDEVLQHRIGIHLGDVFLSSCDVAGNDVNIANRLLGKAEPNGICISQTVYDVVKSRAGLKATYLGPVELKNLREHIPVYKLLLLAGEEAGDRPGMSPLGLHYLTAGAAAAGQPPRANLLRRHRRAVMLGLVGLGIIVLAWAVVSPPWRGRGAAASQNAGAAAPWQDVLPLLQLSTEGVQGQWQAGGGEVSIDATAQNNELPIPLIPRGDYQLEVTFTRLEGESDVVIYLPAPQGKDDAQPAQITLHFGHHKKYDLLAQAAFASSSALAGRNGECFVVLATVKARGDDVDIDVNLNGRHHLSLRVPRSEMKPFSPAWATSRRELLGLGADDVSVKFHSLRLKMLSGHAEPAGK